MNSNALITILEGKEAAIRQVAMLFDAMDLDNTVSLGANCRPGG